MSNTMGIGVSGINDIDASEFFNASMAKDLFGPCEIKPDTMQIPIENGGMIANKDNMD